jgi:hypothetical protein
VIGVALLESNALMKSAIGCAGSGFGSSCFFGGVVVADWFCEVEGVA